MTGHRTVAELEQHVGEQVRSLRKRAGLTQAALARDANVSVGTVRNLETGEGSSLATVIAVSRALGREPWLDELAPATSVSPMALLAASESSTR